MPEGGDDEGGHVCEGARPLARRHQPAEDVEFEPQVDLVIPEAQHLDRRVGRLQIPYVHGHHLVPVAVAVVAEAARDYRTRRETKRIVVEELLELHADVVVADPCGQRQLTVAVVPAKLNRKVCLPDHANCQAEEGLSYPLEAWNDGVWHVCVLMRLLNEPLVMGVLEEDTESARLAVEDIAGHLKHTWHLLDLSLLLVLRQIFLLLAAILVAEGQSLQLARQQHCVASDVHPVGTKVVDHGDEVLVAEVAEDERGDESWLSLAWHQIHCQV